MSVKAQSLENPERDLALTTREGAEEKKSRKPDDGAAAELKTLRERILAAKDLRPQGRDLHCGDCFRRGRDAALRLIEGP